LAPSVSDLVDEQRVGRQLEVLGSMRLKANARQIKLIDVGLIPIALAIERVDQCVASTGFSSNVLMITASPWS
jgi:hypothetical protein